MAPLHPAQGGKQHVVVADRKEMAGVVGGHAGQCSVVTDKEAGNCGFARNATEERKLLIHVSRESKGFLHVDAGVRATEVVPATIGRPEIEDHRLRRHPGDARNCVVGHECFGRIRLARVDAVVEQVHRRVRRVPAGVAAEQTKLVADVVVYTSGNLIVVTTGGDVLRVVSDRGVRLTWDARRRQNRKCHQLP